ncbi:MAG: hypothetical protein KKB50_12065 [Planctomycetes bacterium]|nr:hypothetical protein [Planctomycetota bacterium]
MADEWDMPRRGDTCAQCGHTFEIGEVFRTHLCGSPEGYARRDYCATCSPTNEPDAIALWKTRRPEPATKRVQPFDREAIYAFFQRLEDANEPEQVQFRFVLALLLWRKKMLKFQQSLETDGCETWEFAVPRLGTSHRVARPALDEDELERLSSQLEQLLAGEPGELDIVTATASGERDDG